MEDADFKEIVEERWESSFMEESTMITRENIVYASINYTRE